MTYTQIHSSGHLGTYARMHTRTYQNIRSQNIYSDGQNERKKGEKTSVLNWIMKTTTSIRKNELNRVVLRGIQMQFKNENETYLIRARTIIWFVQIEFTAICTCW